MTVVNPNYVRILAVQYLVWVAKLSLKLSAKISGLRHPGAGMLFSSEQLDPHASTGTSYTLPHCATVINHPFNEREPVPPRGAMSYATLEYDTRTTPHSNQY